MLQVVGINQNDEPIYRALLRHPDSSATDLAGLVDSSPGRVRTALARLEELGLVRRLDARRFVPIAPETALTTLLHRRQAEAEAEFDDVRRVIGDLHRDYRAGELQAHPAGLIEVLVGAEAINRRSLELWQSAEQEILGFDTPPYAWQIDPTYDESETEEPLIERGVRIRAIYAQEALELEGRVALVAHLVRLGEEARTLPELPIKLHIYDRRAAMVPLTTKAEADDSRAIIHPSGLLDALIALFEACWERALPITADPGQTTGPDGELGEEQVTILRMLAIGMKDHSIARQLGLSRRTTTRRVDDVLRALNASSRFQAGAQAARRGWI